MAKVQVFHSKEPELIYNGFFKMRKYNLVVDTLDGKRKQNVVRELFDRGNSVAVLIYDPKLQKVLMIEQFLIGAYAAGIEENAPLQVVAGMIDKGETPLEAATREAAEETGISNLNSVSAGPIFMPSPGGSSERIFTFLVECDLSGVQTGFHGIESEHEDIKTIVMDVDEAIRLMDNGLIENGLAVVLLQFLARNLKK